MDYSVVITTIGGTYGFRLTEDMSKTLKLDVGDEVDLIIMQIFRDGLPQDTNVIIRGEKVIKSGGKFGSITIGRDYIDSLNITKGTTLTIDLSKKK